MYIFVYNEFIIDKNYIEFYVIVKPSTLSNDET